MTQIDSVRRGLLTGALAIRAWVGCALVGCALVGCASSNVQLGPEDHRAELDHIDAIERSRRFDGPELPDLMKHDSPHVRARVFRALSRLRSDAAVALWRDGIAEETDATVISTAAFAAGQWAEWGAPRPEVDDRLWEWTSHADPVVRTVAFEALGERARGRLKAKQPLPPWVARLATGLADGSADVRGAAALALEAGSSEAVEALASALESETDEEVRWRLVYSLARRPEPRSAEIVAALLGDWNPWVRAFAAQGVGSPALPDALPALGTLLADSESHWTARVKALKSLGAIRGASASHQAPARDLLVTHLQRESHPLVIDATLRELAQADPTDLVQPFFDVLTEHGSLTVRRSALVGLGQLIGRAADGVSTSQAAMESLRSHAKAENPYERAAAVRGLGSTGEDVWDDLTRALADESLVVRTTATEAVVSLPTEERWDLLTRLANDDDLAVRTAAVQAYVDQKPAGWIDRLIAIYGKSLAPQYWETRKVIVSAFALTSDSSDPTDASGDISRLPKIERLLESALEDANPGVTEVACRALGLPAPGVETEPFETERFEDATIPYSMLRRERLVAGDNPRVTFDTDRGRIVIELFLEEAPHHVSSFISLVRQGFYDGLSIHRVVPAFVAQGGDPRGDGWGDNGFAMLHEINRRPYLRGAVGMPTAGWDTGGCQFFITHVPTPRLDGAYTVYGQVVVGMEVVDTLEVGDRIRSATLDLNQYHSATESD